jgi:hypothetical protein
MIMSHASAFCCSLFGLAAAGLAVASHAQTTLDTRAAFMSIATNATLKTNLVIVTNYVVVTNLTYTTNFYNAQGQLLQPVAPAIPGLIPIPGASPAPATPDPAVLQATQAQAIKDLLSGGVLAASNTLCSAGSFSSNTAITIQIPDGVTVFDRKKGQALLAAMNNAAEKAAPEALAVIQQKVNQLKLENPAQLLQGGADAATTHFNSTEGQRLAEEIQPIVQRAATAAGVDQAYQNVMLKGGGLFGAVLGTSKGADVNAHITHGLMDAIYKTMTAQENLLRTSPAARKTKALQEALKR